MGNMSQPFAVVDAFTDRPFSGNPGAICVMSGPAGEGWMQAVAAEMNLSETAFLYPEGDGGAHRLRWFTPKVEIELCGHGTLAAAHVLWESERLPRHQEARFESLSGPLTARRDGAFITLDFPARIVEPCPPPAGLPAALGVDPLSVARFAQDYLVELPSPAAVRAVTPDFRALAALPLRAVAVTAAGDGAPYDIVSRFFAPGAGIPEDPVTGSAHCALGPFWAARLGKRELLAHQASARGGTLRVTPRGARVLLSGQAVTVSRGEILPTP
jgi:PhzF family phenazine biosynthesis protein